MNTPSRVLGLVVVIAFCAPVQASGQQSSPDDLARRVAALERRNDDLEKRLRVLESRLNPASPAPAAEPRSGDWHSLAYWRRLKRGMSYEEVRSLLGEPDQVSG